MEDEFKPSVQPQRRVNPNIKEVVKKEFIKLLDARLIYPISNSPWRCMTAIFHELIDDSMEVFMDDFSIFGNSFNHCLKNPEKMLKTCDEANLVLNWEKCHFMVKEGIVIGHKISRLGIEIDKAKIKAISKLPYLKNVKAIRSFLGHAVDHLSRLENPDLGKLTKAEIRDLFLEERLMAIPDKNNEPWYADYANYLASRNNLWQIVHKAYWAIKNYNMDLTKAGANWFLQINELDEMRLDAYKSFISYKEKTKGWHDKRIKTPINYEKGDKTLLFNSRLRLFPRKLKSRLYGPFSVSKDLKNRAIELYDEDVNEFISIMADLPASPDRVPASLDHVPVIPDHLPGSPGPEPAFPDHVVDFPDDDMAVEIEEGPKEDQDMNINEDDPKEDQGERDEIIQRRTLSLVRMVDGLSDDRVADSIVILELPPRMNTIEERLQTLVGDADYIQDILDVVDTKIAELRDRVDDYPCEQVNRVNAVGGARPSKVGRVRPAGAGGARPAGNVAGGNIVLEVAGDLLEQMIAARNRNFHEGCGSSLWCRGFHEEKERDVAILKTKRWNFGAFKQLVGEGGGDVFDLIGDEDPSDEDEGTGMGDSTGVPVSLGEISLEGNKS
uniref:Reverse transcriptase domain-containing protein n=1 Tax=Tanacetum cinerariifolium TaxID=118510 RepID=A0A6L2NPR8_TANCI|nr:hypothetical protein [Tanacetum cinerariifolium]